MYVCIYLSISVYSLSIYQSISISRFNIYIHIYTFWYVCMYVCIYLSIYLSISAFSISIYLSIYLSILVSLLTINPPIRLWEFSPTKYRFLTSLPRWTMSLSLVNICTCRIESLFYRNDDSFVVRKPLSALYNFYRPKYTKNKWSLYKEIYYVWPECNTFFFIDTSTIK